MSHIKKTKRRTQKKQSVSYIDLGNGLKVFGDALKTLTRKNADGTESLITNFSNTSDLGKLIDSDVKIRCFEVYPERIKVESITSINKKVTITETIYFDKATGKDTASPQAPHDYLFGQFFQICPEHIFYETGNKRSVGNGEIAITRKGYFYKLWGGKGFFFLRPLVTGQDVSGTIWVRNKGYYSSYPIGHCPSYCNDDTFVANVDEINEYNPYKEIGISFTINNKKLTIKY